MSLAKNLQILRKNHNLSQEELASRLDVSRQAVSKWESGEAYPETEKIITLCDMFGCNMDELVRGDLRKIAQPTANPLAAENYDHVMTNAARGRAAGVGIILLSVALMLTASGLMPTGDQSDVVSAVIILLGIIIALPLLIINNSKLRDFRRQNPKLSEIYPNEIIATQRAKYIKLFAAGVAVILFGVITLLILLGLNLVPINNTLAAAILLYFVTLGEPLLFYTSMMSAKYDIAKYNHQNTPEYLAKARKAYTINVIVFAIATIIFLLWGTITDSWNTNWVVYPVALLLCVIVNALFGRSRRFR